MLFTGNVQFRKTVKGQAGQENERRLIPRDGVWSRLDAHGRSEYRIRYNFSESHFVFIAAVVGAVTFFFSVLIGQLPSLPTTSLIVGSGFRPSSLLFSTTVVLPDLSLVHRRYLSRSLPFTTNGANCFTISSATTSSCGL